MTELGNSAHFTDKNGVEYSGEQLLLAMLLKTTGHKNKRGKRSARELEDIQRIMHDQNLDS